jgi:oligopeptide/dipeptide ABC transporter ATP-binding protein
VKYFSRRIFVMYAGNLIEKADTRRLLANPLHPYTHALLAATSDPDAHNAETFKEVPPGEPPSLVNPPSGCRFHPRCPHFMAGLCDVKFPPDFESEPGHFVAAGCMRCATAHRRLQRRQCYGLNTSWNSGLLKIYDEVSRFPACPRLFLMLLGIILPF